MHPLVCLMDKVVEATGHTNCYLSRLVHLEYLILRYERKDHRNRTMVMKSCFYMAQMSVNGIITWLNQCVQHVILVEKVLEIGY